MAAPNDPAYGMTAGTLPATGLAAKAEKADWYREVLDLEPGSRVFLPYARLLREIGRADEASRVLQNGLAAHPEFIEARLVLIDLLHQSGNAAAAAAEVARLASLFREYPGFWDAWSAVAATPDEKPDLAVSLGFLGAMFRDNGLTLTDVLAAGLRSLRGTPGARPAERAEAPESSAKPAPAADVPAPPAAPVAAPRPRITVTLVPPVPAAPVPAMPAPAVAEAPAETAPETSGEASPEVPGEAPPPLFVFGNDAPQASPRAFAAGEEKCSLRTRSMADILAEQGDLRGAADIYAELLAQAPPEEAPALRGRLDALNVRLGEEMPHVAYASSSSQPRAVGAQPRGVVDLLEKLASRLETKARR